MDGVSAAASVIALVQISEEIFKLCESYYSAVKGAREEIRRLRNEVLSLKDVLTSVEELADAPGAAKLSTLQLLNKPGGLIEECKKELQELVQKLKIGQEEDHMRRFGATALKWPFKKKGVETTIAIIDKHKEMFNLALTADTTTLNIAIDQGITQLRQGLAHLEEHLTHLRIDLANARGDGLRNDILKWLACTDPSSNHLAACKRREPETGNWFVNGSKFEVWKQTSNSLLWLYGIPGCGKTVLSSTIIEQLKSHCNTLCTSGVIAYFYFDFSDLDKQRLSNFASSLITQLCNKAVTVPEQVVKMYEKCENGQQKPSVQDLTATLSATIKDFDNVYIVVDALDECPKSGDREELLSLIVEIHSWSVDNLHMMVTSRPEADIKMTLAPLVESESISLQGSQVDSDINLHIKSQLAAEPKLKSWPEDVKAEIENALSQKANGMFRWVFCQIEALKKCRKRPSLLKTLEGLPDTLDETYARILSEIDEGDQTDARNALMWLAFSKRPLLLKEVAEAAVINPDSDSPFSPDDRLLNPCDSILEILGSLVDISVPEDLHGSIKASENAQIKLAHFSVQDFLVSERIKNPKIIGYSATSIGAHEFIARSCLSYILDYSDSKLNTATREDLQLFPLLSYTCKFWSQHAKSVTLENRNSLDALAFRLIASKIAYCSWLNVHDIFYSAPFDRFRSAETYNPPLFYASYLGLEAVVSKLLALGESTGKLAYNGQTALHAAAQNGHEVIARLLLDHNVSTDVLDEDSCSAFYLAAEQGHEAAALLLLEHNANITLRRTDGSSALHAAAERRHEPIVRLLLDHNAGVDWRDNSDRQPLYYAAKWGFVPVVRLLLERQSDPDAQDAFGRTALQIAAQRGHKEVVDLLLQRRVDINARDEDGESALWKAAIGRHTPIMELLLEHGADIDTTNEHFETLLMMAAWRGNETLIKLLIQKGSDVNKGDRFGLTALSFAIRYDQFACARLLLENNAEIRNTLHEASDMFRGLKILRLLLEFNADVNAKDENGRTALHLAAADYGQVENVKALLENGADINATDEDGKTALHLAIQDSNDDIVELLLEKKVDLDLRDATGQTPLHYAVDSGSVAMVRLLLNNKANIEAKDDAGQTALHYTARKGDEAVVALLLEAKPDPDVKDVEGKTSLDLALDRQGQEELKQEEERKTAAKITQQRKKKLEGTRQRQEGRDQVQERGTLEEVESDSEIDSDLLSLLSEAWSIASKEERRREQHATWSAVVQLLTTYKRES